jgi:hypothetical protein
VEPHWLSDGGGGVGVYPPHDYESKKKKLKKKLKKKIKKKKLNYLDSIYYILIFDQKLKV